MCNLKKFLAMALALVLVLSCAPVIPFTARAEAETPAPVAEPEFTDAAEASDWVMAVKGFKVADLATYKEAEALLNGTTHTEAHARISAAITKLESEGYSYYDDFVAFGTYKSTMDDSALQPGDAFVATENTTNYDIIFGGAYAQRLEENKMNGTTVVTNAANTFPKAVDMSSFRVPTFHFGEYYYGQTKARYWNSDHTTAIEGALSKTAGTEHQITHKFNRVVLKDTASGRKTGENVTAFSVTIDPRNHPVIFFDYRDVNNWSAILPNISKTQLHFVTCTDGVLNYPAVFTENGRWNPSRTATHTLTTTYYTWGSNYSDYYQASDFSMVGTFTLNFVWDEDHYNVSMHTPDGTALPLFNKETVMALDASKLGRAPQMLSNIVISDIYNNCNSGNITTGSGYANGIVSISAKFENYCAHVFNKQDVTTAVKKYEANCTNLATYYAQCSLCDVSAKGIDEDATFFDPNGTPGDCVYEHMHDAFVHWEQCPGCMDMKPDTAKEAHNTAGAEGACSVCGFVATDEETALSALSLKGFYGDALAGYQAGLFRLEAKKADETPINDTTSKTWKEAYDRLNKAVLSLTGGMTYYDDFMVFGRYVSDMDDTGLVAGDKFVASTNTTNYDIIFGGAYAQRLTASISGKIAAGNLAHTFPMAVDVDKPFFPSFHFGRWDYAGATAENKTYSDTSEQWSANNYAAVAIPGTGLNQTMLNRMVLNNEKIGVDGINVLERFTVITDNHSKRLRVYVDYTDTNNWTVLELSNASNRTSFTIHACVNGEVIQKVHTDVWDLQGRPANNSAYNSSNPNSWLVSGNVIHNFVWDYTNNCYVYTAIHQDTGKTIWTKSFDATLLGYTPKKMSTLMMMGIQHYNRTQADQTNAFSVVKGISVKFVDASAEPHVCTPTGNWISDNNGNHYKNCSCGRKVESSVMSCNIPDEFTTVDGVHTKACADCRYVAEQGNCTAGDLIHDGTNHWRECTVCGTEITGTKEACATTGGYQWENDQHWATYACGAELPKKDCSGTEYHTENGEHQLKCATCGYVYGEKKPCSGTELVNDGTNGHYTKCATCGVKIDSTVEAHNKEVPATYEANAFCSCGYEHEGTMLEKIAPVILGSKILKAGAAVDQKLRIDIDFTDVLKSLQGSTETIVCGAIVHPLNSDIMTDNALDLTKLKNFKDNSKYDVKSRLTGHAEDMLMRLTIGMDAADFGKRVAVIAYIQVGDTVIYSSDSNQPSKDNENVGLKDGVIQTGVMRVMKAILKDATNNGYNAYIATAAENYINSGIAPQGVTKDAVIGMVNQYLDGTIHTGSTDYVTARTYAMNVFFYCSIIADSKS